MMGRGPAEHAASSNTNTFLPCSQVVGLHLRYLMVVELSLATCWVDSLVFFTEQATAQMQARQA